MSKAKGTVSTLRYDRKCDWCNTRFIAKSKKGIFCSGNCRKSNFFDNKQLKNKKFRKEVALLLGHILHLNDVNNIKIQIRYFLNRSLK